MALIVGFGCLLVDLGLGLAGLWAVSGCLVVLVWFSRVVVLIALIVDFGCEFCVILAFELVLLSEFPTGGLGVLGCLLFWVWVVASQSWLCGCDLWCLEVWFPVKLGVSCVIAFGVGLV